jgi:hypothetical protein
MDFDPRDELWNAAFNTYYDAYYEEIAADKMISRWQILDELTKVLVALTASGSAISGWALWSDVNFKYIWIVMAGTGALLALIHSTLGVPGRLKDWGEIKRWFAIIRIDLETFRYQMTVDPEFSVDNFSKNFIDYRRRYGEGVQRLKNDILRTNRLERKSQTDLNERIQLNS